MSATIVGAIVAFVTIPLGAALWRDAPPNPQQTQQNRQVDDTTTTAEITLTTTRLGSPRPTVVQLTVPDTTPQALTDSAKTTSVSVVTGSSATPPSP